MKTVIGLTGMSGAGKSTFAKGFAACGATVVDCDAIAHKALEDGEVKASLVKAFGDGILAEDGTVSRKNLAAVAFADAVATSTLNGITHPYILEKTKRQVEAVESTAVIDAPLLFQSGLDDLCHITLAVVAPKDVRIDRICRRDGLTREQAERRLSAQVGMEDLLKQADVTVENGETLSETDQNSLIQRLYAYLLSFSGRE